jgi:HD-like signal output (HDOD) protein/ActR/RegA family two-component response regulator
MIQVLFVDDEPRLLEGLRVGLRAQRTLWRMHFAASGEAAMDLLQVHRFDVVVSDMRMPRVDGAQVLGEALRLQPWAARLVLSGYAELESTLRAVPVAHQFLSKPCDLPALVNVVDRTAGLQRLLDDPALRAVVGRVTTLPSLPTNFLAVMATLADGEADAETLARVIERDVAMCAKVLQLTNSAFFGLPRVVASIEEAIVYLGFGMVRSLVLVAEVFRSGGEDLAELERHSLTVGSLARRLASAPEADEASVAGMLHDVGTLLLRAVKAPAGGGEAQGLSGQNAAAVSFEAERAQFGTTHAEVGGYLLGLWGLPWPLVEAVANHHAPQRVRLQRPGPLTAVAVADALVRELEGRALPGEVLEHLAALKLEPGALEGWRVQARDLLQAG